MKDTRFTATVTRPWTFEGLIIRALIKRIRENRIEIHPEELVPPATGECGIVFIDRNGGCIIDYHEQEGK